MAGRGKGVLRIAIEDFLDTFGLGKILNKWFKEVGEEQEFTIADFNKDLLDIIKDTPDLPESIKKLTRLKRGDDAQGGILSMGGFAAGIGQSMAGGILQPIVSSINYSMDRIVRSARPDIQTLISAHRRGFISDEDVAELGKQLGWSDYLQEMWSRLTLQILGAGELLTLWRRGEITENELDIRLREQAFDDKIIGQLKELTQIIPGVGDLINMAVKEAFNPAIVKKFGYDQEFPEEVAVWAGKQGLSREWAEKYWYAHWLTPSIGQGFEMLHRLRPGVGDNTFIESDMRELLKILDVPIYWRDKLIDISYNPLTRVDVRRMHDLGNLDEQGVKDAYLDSGYNEENAQLMTEFTLDYNKEPIKLLSKEVVLRAFKKGMFSEGEALDILVTAGWTTDQGKFYLSMASFDMLEKETDLETDLIHDLYLASEILKNQVHTDLNSLNLPETQIKRLLKEWELEKLKKVRLPTEAELETWYKLDYVTAEDYEAGLVARNYKPDTVEFYIRQADQDIAEKMQKIERDLLDTQEKLQLDIMTGTYRIKTAGLNVRVASLKSDIADIKLMIHDVKGTDMEGELKKRIDEIKVDISDLQVEKAELTLSQKEETEEEE